MVTITRSNFIKDKWKDFKNICFSMRFTITAAYFAVIIVTLFLMSAYVVGLLSNNLYNTKTIDMFEKANIISDAASEQWDKDINIAGMRLVDITGRSLAGTTIRCIVTNSSYTVLYDTNTESGLIGKAYMRDEIKRALDGEQYHMMVKEEKSDFITASVPIYSGKDIIGSVYLAQNVSDIENAVSSLRGSLIFFCVIIVAIIGLLSVGISFAITSPLKEFQEIASEISKGNFKKRIKKKGVTEFVQLGETMNYMCDELNLIEERRRKFVSDVSHELKTPMATIKLVCDSITGSEDCSPEMVREFLGDMSDEVDRLTRIVERLLELSKLDGSTTLLKPQEVDVKSMLNDIVKKLSDIAMQQNITVYRDFIDNDYSVINADYDKLYEALYNITDNAIKYSKESGYVKIDAKENDGFIVISVEDTGDGIPDSEKERIFDRFYRIDNSRSRDTGGTGLGLAIAKEAVLMHGGSINITHSDDGGSIFTVIIPVGQGAIKEVEE